MTKVTEDYPGGSISNEELKRKAIQDANLKPQANQSKFPTEIIELPSKGLVYDISNPLHTGKVEMKYMTAKEEDILTSANLIQKGVVIDSLLRALVVGNSEGLSINYNDLVIGDKNAIMIAARVLGYGADYPVEIACPSCQHKNSVNVNLADLNNKSFDESNFDNNNEFDFKLPASKRVLTFKILSHGDEKAIDSEAKRMKKRTLGSAGVTFELTSRLKSMILSVDGDTEVKTIKSFVENEFLSRDSLAFRKYVESISPDVDMTVYFECDSCEHVDTSIQMPMNVNFFWPGA